LSKIVCEREIHALLKYGGDVEKYLCFAVSERFLFLLVVKEIDGFGDSKNITLSDTANDVYFLSEQDDLFVTESDYTE
jgi:hypothetical protein